MSRYIDADLLKKEIFAHWYTCEEIDETIDNQPTANVIPACDGPYSYRYPIANRYIHAVDTDCEMLECPECGCRIIADWFSFAVGSKGYAFCPYCGADLRKEENDGR